MRCQNERCELYGQDITAQNREEDGSLSPRETCPVCGEGLVLKDEGVRMKSDRRRPGQIDQRRRQRGGMKLQRIEGLWKMALAGEVSKGRYLCFLDNLLTWYVLHCDSGRLVFPDGRLVMPTNILAAYRLPDRPVADAALCRYCRWWDRSAATSRTEARPCRHRSNMQDMNEYPPLDGVGDVDVGMVWTGPDFGCVHFEHEGVDDD